MTSDDVWDTWMVGRVVVGLCEALWKFSEDCPEHGTDKRKIGDWHEIMQRLACLVEESCRFADWDSGASLARAVDDHFRELYERSDWSAPLTDEWMQGLLRRCANLTLASRSRWERPKELDDDGDDE